MDDTELLSILVDAGDGLDPVGQGGGSGWGDVHAYVEKLIAERDQQAVEIARLRAGLELIAVPPYSRSEEPGCAACSAVAQATLDGRDYHPNVAQLEGSYPVVFNTVELGVLVSLLNDLLSLLQADPADKAGPQFVKHLRNRLQESQRNSG
jgi:hypothetical protein